MTKKGIESRRASHLSTLFQFLISKKLKCGKILEKNLDELVYGYVLFYSL